MTAFDGLLREALTAAAMLGLPVLLAATAVGTAVALLQAATQVQEQTLVLLPKILAVVATLVMLGGFGMHLCAQLFTDALAQIPALVSQ